jgi:hypothetical protein
VGSSVATELRDDWHQPDDLVGLIGSAVAEDSAKLATLMDIDVPGQERLEFLGGASNARPRPTAWSGGRSRSSRGEASPSERGSSSRGL